MSLLDYLSKSLDENTKVEDKGLGKFFNYGARTSKQIENKISQPKPNYFSGLSQYLSDTGKQFLSSVKDASSNYSESLKNIRSDIDKKKDYTYYDALKTIGRVSSSVGAGMFDVGAGAVKAVTPKFVEDEVKDIWEDTKKSVSKTWDNLPEARKKKILGGIKEDVGGVKKAFGDVKSLTYDKLPKKAQYHVKEGISSGAILAGGLFDAFGGVGKKGKKFVSSLVDELDTRVIRKEFKDRGIDISETVAKKFAKAKTEKDVNKVFKDGILKREKSDFLADYKGETPSKNKWEEGNIIKDTGKYVTRGAANLYGLPRVRLENMGLKKDFYDPVIKATRDAQDVKTNFFNKLDKAGLWNRGATVTNERFKLSKKERQQMGKYVLDRQGRKTGVKFEDLSPKAQKTMKIFDEFIKENKKDIFRVAKKNGIELEEFDNYAPLMTKKDLKLSNERPIVKEIEGTHPSFSSLNKRAEEVPIEYYETDYGKVMTRWVDQMADFKHIGDVVPDLKNLTKTEKMVKNVAGENIKYVDKWLDDIVTPEKIDFPKAVARKARSWSALSSLGLAPFSVAKQVLTQIPMILIEKAPPKFLKWKSDKYNFAKDFNKKVSELPAIKQRKGMPSIADMQDGYSRAVVGALTDFDKFNATKSLNRLLDKSYKKYGKTGLPITDEIQDLIMEEAQDSLDLWYGGMTKGHLPEAYRTEVGKLINMFMYPTTSQLNGFIYTAFKDKGIKGARKKAEVLAAALAVAYMEQAITKMAFNWGSDESMVEDVVQSLAGNIPVLGSVLYGISNDKDYMISPVAGGFNTLFRAIGDKIEKGDKSKFSNAEMAAIVGEVFGFPKQIRRSATGVDAIKKGSLTDKRGKMMVPFVNDDWMEKTRAFLKGKYGSIAANDLMYNRTKPKEERRWLTKEAELFGGGDPRRKVEILETFSPEVRKDMLQHISKSGRDEITRWKLAKDYPNVTDAVGLATLFKKFGIGTSKKASKPQILNHYKRIIETKMGEKPKTWERLDAMLKEFEKKGIGDTGLEKFVKELGVAKKKNLMPQQLQDSYKKKLRPLMLKHEVDKIYEEKDNMLLEDWLNWVKTKPKEIKDEVGKRYKLDKSLGI